jgi:hypothetical protein
MATGTCSHHGFWEEFILHIEFRTGSGKKMKEKILKLKLLIAKLQNDAPMKAELEAEIAELEAATAANIVPTPTTKDSVQLAPQHQPLVLPAEVTAALGEMKTLKEMLLKQEERATAAETAMAERMKSEKAQKKVDYLKKVTETEKKVTPAEWKEKYEALYDAVPEAAMKVIDALQVHPASRQTKTIDGKTEDGRGEKTTSLKNYVDHKESFDAQAIAAFTAPSNN